MEYATTLNWAVLTRRSRYIRALVQDVGGCPDHLEVPNDLSPDLLDEVMEVLGDPADDENVARSLASIVVAQRDAYRYVNLLLYLAVDKVFKLTIQIVVSEMPRRATDLLVSLFTLFSTNSAWADFIFNFLSKITCLSRAKILERITDRWSAGPVRRSPLQRLIRSALRGTEYHRNRTRLYCLMCNNPLWLRVRTNHIRVHYETRMLCCAYPVHRNCFWEAVQTGECRFCGTVLRSDGTYDIIGRSADHRQWLNELWEHNEVNILDILIPPHPL